MVIIYEKIGENEGKWILLTGIIGDFENAKKIIKM